MTAARLRAAAIALGVLQFVTTSYAIFSDGISYLEIARRYAEGNWSAAVNSYWSPLLSWLLAACFVVFRVPRPHDLVVLHAIALAAYVAGVFAFENLLHALCRAMQCEWLLERASFLLTAYGLYIWAGLCLIGIWHCSPDLIVMLLVLLIAGVVLRIRLEEARPRRLLLLGLLLGLACLTKAAMLPLSAIYVISVLSRDRRERTKRLVLVMAPFILVVSPFLLALHHRTGTWTAGRSGVLNYAWEVAGVRRSLHWQGEPGGFGTPAHPTRRISVHPAIYEFATPIEATYAPWYDPSYWYEGVRAPFRLADQVKAIRRNLRLLLPVILLAPGLAPLLVVMVWRRPPWAGFLRLWWLWLPSVLCLGMYTAVFLDQRYVAGHLLVLLLPVTALVLSRAKSPSACQAVALGAVAVLLWQVGVYETIRVYQLVKNGAVHPQIAVARELRSYGLKPGDKVCYIGRTMDAYWPYAAQVRVVCEIPIRYDRDPVKGGLILNYSDIEEFWNLPPDLRVQALNTMKNAGARLVFADDIPQGADVSGWTRMKSTRREMMFRMLDSVESRGAGQTITFSLPISFSGG